MPPKNQKAKVIDLPPQKEEEPPPDLDYWQKIAERNKKNKERMENDRKDHNNLVKRSYRLKKNK